MRVSDDAPSLLSSPLDTAQPDARVAPQRHGARVVLWDAATDASAMRAEPEVPQASKQLDPFASVYMSMGLLDPPFGQNGYATIVYRYDESDALQSAVDAMVTNVCAFGLQFAPYASDLPAETSKEIETERRRLAAWFAHASSDGSFSTMRKRVRRDVELFGDGYYEILRARNGDLAGMEHIPAETMRKSRLDASPVLAKGWARGEDGRFVERTLWRRFRRFAQFIDGRFVWFKTLGDPRPIRADNGEIDPNAAPEQLANEVLNVCRYEPGSAYGKPRWRGSATSVKGRSDAGAVNADIFDNRGIPPMAILLQGATFDDDVIERVKEHFRALRGKDRFHRPLILEATAATTSDPADPGGLSRPGAAPKIDFKDLSAATQTDGQFLKYRDECVRDVAMTFRLPPLYMGRTDSYNFATAQAARQVAEEQVFQPERADEDDLLNALVLPELGARWCKLTTKGPPLLDEKTLIQVIDLGVRSGALTVANVADLLEPIVGLELSSPESWRKLPAMVLRALADKGVLPAEIAAVLGEPVHTTPAGAVATPPGATDGSATNDPASEDAANAEKPAGEGSGDATVDASATNGTASAMARRA